MKLAWLVLLFVVGCSKTSQTPHVMYGTHKVWENPSYMIYQDPQGFTCSKIDRSDNGYVYTATLVWSAPDVDIQTWFQEFNKLDDAERWAERWCKP